MITPSTLGWAHCLPNQVDRQAVLKEVVRTIMPLDVAIRIAQSLGTVADHRAGMA